MKRDKFFAGDRVVVRSPLEILATLDANGTLDGHPFMPEMLDRCGKSYRVHRRVEKTCVETPPPLEPNRRFAKNDVVTLEGLRCDGSAHDGCKRGCRFYWKEAWLRPADGNENEVPVDAAALSALRARLKVKAGAGTLFLPVNRTAALNRSLSGKNEALAGANRVAADPAKGPLPAGNRKTLCPLVSRETPSRRGRR